MELHFFEKILTIHFCIQNVTTHVLLALFNLLNCAYDPSNHPAYRFAETIPELIPLVESPNFDISSTAKFTLSCLRQQLDCDQLLALKLTDKEAEYCVTTLGKSINLSSFKSDGFAVSELLTILTNLTWPYTAMKRLMEVKLAGARKHSRPVEMGYFDQQMLKTADELEKNSQMVMRYGLLNVMERVLRVEQFQEAATKLLCNLLHSEAVRAVVGSDFPDIIELLQSQCETSPHEDHQLIAYCCLWRTRAVKQG